MLDAFTKGWRLLKTILSAKEQIMFDEIMPVINGVATVEQAAAKLGVSRRTIYRKISAYVYEGIDAFSHKSKGSTPHNALNLITWKSIQELYEHKYFGYNFSHFQDMLKEHENIKISYATIYHILNEAGFKSPRAHRKKRKKQHPIRERRAKFGELVQMDGSFHLWFGDRKATLHLAIDDASSRVLGAYFDWHETLNGYYGVFYQVLTSYGVPYKFYTDRRNIFVSKAGGNKSLTDDVHTQFRMAAAQVGVAEIKTTSVPQAKGRVERAFGTFQDRLVSEMRTAAIATIDKANAFLEGFVCRHNARFALCHSHLENAFGPRPTEEEITLALAKVSERKVLSGCIISYQNQKYMPIGESGQVYLPKGTEILVIESYDRRLLMSLDNMLWPLMLAGKPVPAIKPKPIVSTLYEERRYRYLIKRYREAA
jgi:transposase